MQWGCDGRAQVIRPHYEDACATLINQPVAASSPPNLQSAAFLLHLLLFLSPLLNLHHPPQFSFCFSLLILLCSSPLPLRFFTSLSFFSSYSFSLLHPRFHLLLLHLLHLLSFFFHLLHLFILILSPLPSSNSSSSSPITSSLLLSFSSFSSSISVCVCCCPDQT